MKENDLKEIEKEEIERLERVALIQINSSLRETNSIVVLTLGFCLATLSATQIPAIVNLIMVFLILCLSGYILLHQRKNNNTLNMNLSALREKYKKHAGTQKHLDYVDPWKGFSESKILLWGPIFISVFFCIYALVEHFLRLPS